MIHISPFLLSTLLAMLFCIIVGFACFSRLPGSIKLIPIHAVLGLTMEIIGMITSRGHTVNHVYFNFFVPIDFTVFLLASKSLVGKDFYRLAIPATLIFFIAFTYDLVVGGVYFIAYHAISISWLMLAIVYFWALTLNISRQPGNFSRGVYLISGVSIMYYCCTIPGFSLTKYLQDQLSTSTTVILKTLNGIFTVRYFIYAIGLWFIANRAKKASADKPSAFPMPAEKALKTMERNQRPRR